MKKRIIGLIISVIIAIIFWTANITYASNIGFHTELNVIQSIIVILLTIASYLSVGAIGIFIGLLLMFNLERSVNND